MKRYIKIFLLTVTLCPLLFFTSSCGKEEAYVSPVGSWRGVLKSPGGELAFWLDIKSDGSRVLNGGVRNGKEFLPFTRVESVKRDIKMSFDHYDSIIDATIADDAKKMNGTWSRRSLKGKRTEMEFYAEKIAADSDSRRRFPPIKNTGEGETKEPTDIDGEWQVEFTDKGGKTSAKAIFSQNESYLEGTFLTEVGDYRFLEGTYEGGVLRLSVFDGAHAFLFRARADENGMLKGDFWSRGSYHATWTAVKGSIDMPDPFTLTTLTNDEKRFSFRFPNLRGEAVSDEDERFKNRVLLVYVFGTWCPNCNDEAPFLEELYREYHDRGLEIVGLANEFTGEFEKDKEMVGRYIKKYGLSWPVLIVGIADKEKTSEALSDLDRVKAYPTTVFIDRQKQVQKIYTGFSGPGTGKYYQTLRNEFKQIIESLLVEKEKEENGEEAK
ncbi:MAG: TlpA family protein disulfide reductase [bacterium]|nr:TlpA family protein disulfide reductase [bacterium]